MAVLNVVSRIVLLTLITGLFLDAHAEVRERRSPIAPVDRVECSACRVAFFDGLRLQELAVAADGTVVVPAAGTVFITGSGQVPQVRNVGPGRPLGAVRLLPARGGLGFVAVAVVRARGGPLQSAPVPGRELAVGPYRVVTDPQGGAVVAVPAGRCEVVVGDRRYSVEVPPGGTTVLPLLEE